MKNPYKVIQIGTREHGTKIYGVVYKDYPHVGIPDSWGTKAHALKYMAALLGMTYDQYQKCKGRLE